MGKPLVLPDHTSGFIKNDGTPTPAFYSWLKFLQSKLKSTTIVNVVDFGADPAGNIDSAAGIQAAINSLPDQGGDVFFPAGQYDINTTINLGNGDATHASLRWGVRLVGEGMNVTTTDSDLLDNGNSAVTLYWQGAAGGTMISVNGPLDGWGISRMGLNGLGSAAIGVLVNDACSGRMEDVTIRGATTAGLALRSPSSTLGIGTSHNGFDKIYVVGNGSSHGIEIDGVGRGSFYNIFNNTTVIVANGDQALYLGACDNNYFYGFNVTGTGAANSVVFDYTNGAGANFPNSNGFMGVDLNSFLAVNVGAPNAGLLTTGTNWFRGFTRGNGMVPPYLAATVSHEVVIDQIAPVLVANLDAGAPAGTRAFVSDATVTTFASIVAGTGGNKVPVYSDGTNWRIG